ncbi:T5orf172 domain-containing protein [Bosea sp. OK403]|uniref:GIY-YIG nuclease family protein n=1 Tax=Bosea sp. OK403 TaxID=1855286 RepID=UPI0008EC891C|nr:GIY-YIG nuclease family protein [Bosea sp. OK403]SFI77513.1 T5orf172 domain-containing protein [Bosea sp. OK403]
MNREKRFGELYKVPPLAALDHRLFLNSKGEDERLQKIPRHIRRKMKVEGQRIGKKYINIMNSIKNSGVGYQVDALIRQFSIEYTHRYASSGLLTQPASFNYFEPFCSIKLIERSTAPYIEPLAEIDHLFSVSDFFDYLTSKDTPQFTISDLAVLPEGVIYNFTQNGALTDFTYMTPEGREFVISGFSMVRHGNSIHWFVLGGEILSESEWNERVNDEFILDPSGVPPEKRKFIDEIAQRQNGRSGAPLALEGTQTAIRTIVAGETDLITFKHVARCHMQESENTFHLYCDDPEVFSGISDVSEREEILNTMRDRIESASVMWNMAEGFLQLFSYFRFKLTIPLSSFAPDMKAMPKGAKGGQGIGARFKHVTSIEVSDINQSVLRSYTSPHLDVETEGHWRRIAPESYGRDRDGNQIKGRTWVKVTNKWRARADHPKSVYIKSSVAAAKIQISDYIRASHEPDLSENRKQNASVLYVMRCAAMKEEIYKVGWTSNSAEQRARELSLATGVPLSFVVVDAWQHPDPAALEKGVHALLTPYRLNDSREFFSLKYPQLKGIIETEIKRTERYRGR